MYKANSQGSLFELEGGILTLVITETMLSEWTQDDPIRGVVSILVKYFPDLDQIVSLEVDESKVKQEARIHVVNASCFLSDRLFMARVWFMAIETILNRGRNSFTLRFPYIEGNE
jgi:hypothetical protein